MTIEEALADRREPTQFGRPLEELGVELILARSPQGKGRVERLCGTFQDRLASGVAAGEGDDAGRSRRRAPSLPGSPQPPLCGAGRRSDAGLVRSTKGRPLDELFCFKYRRVVANDHTIRLRAQVIDIPPNPSG